MKERDLDYIYAMLKMARADATETKAYDGRRGASAATDGDRPLTNRQTLLQTYILRNEISSC